jgi:iron complex outermembrane receptor protein
MNKTLLAFTCLLFSVLARSQDPDTLPAKDLSEIIITAFKDEAAITSPLNILPIKVDSLSRYGNYNLTDLLAKSPGVTMLTTGVAIAKPVIRGLYGNRVLILLSGLKFDNQQWQEEHGLGLSDLGLQKVELIKGPMSVLYGTEAIGGLINLIEEQKPDSIGKNSDCSLKFNSNTLGGLLQAGIRKNMGKNWYGLRLGIENNADYADGNGDRVLNSRFDGYYLKAAYGFQKKNWISDNHFMSSFNRFGFIFNDVYDFIEPDDRWSRKLTDFPAHFVLLNILSSENKIYLKDEAKLTINAGVQSNVRMENEGGGAISLNMHLFTAQYLAKWEKELSRGNRLILSTLGSFENNENYGSRKIIPDANMQEANLSIYYEMQPRPHFLLEYGVSVGEKWIKTFFTPTVNGPDKDIQPFDKFEPYWNAFTGISLFPAEHFNLKFNVATGVRIPNLAELSSDGLHEGIFTL